MGEFDDEIEVGHADSELAAETGPKASDDAPDSAQVEEPVAADDPSAAIQDQLALDGPDGDSPSEVTADESDASGESPSGAEAPEVDAEPAVALEEASEGEATEETASDSTLADGEAEDDLAAAIAASNEQVGTETTLDDIPPGTSHPMPDEPEVAETVVRYGAPWWPFLVYLGLWVAFAGVAVWQFEQFPPSIVVYEATQYTAFLVAGLALAALGVVLILAVWIGARMSPTRQRRGLFVSAMIKGSVCILIGTVVWWGALLALDYLRLGRLI
jgi:hypothetical protein